MEQALVQGDLISLSPEERVQLYFARCKSLRLNPLTEPFGYILFRETDDAPEKLVLYAKADCAMQLSHIHGVSEVKEPRRWRENGMLYAEVYLEDRTGRKKTDIGVIPMRHFSRKRNEWYDLSGAALANAEMKVGTKAYRRCILRLCGLSMMDESEFDTMRITGGVTKEGRIFRYEQPLEPEHPQLPPASVGLGHDVAVLMAQFAIRRGSKESFDALVKNNEAGLRTKTREQLEFLEKQYTTWQQSPQESKPAPAPTTEAQTQAGAAAYIGLCYTKMPTGENYKVDGPDELKKKYRELEIAKGGRKLRDCWLPNAHAIVVTPQELGHLIARFEELKEPFKEWQPSAKS